jgi:predicted phage-related endonuclease
MAVKPKEWHEARRTKIGGSDANIIMSGNPGAILNLWKVKTGLVQPEDLSDEFRVVLGGVTEEFNRWWFTRTTDIAVLEGGPQRVSKAHPFMATNLDGEAMHPDGGSAVFEAKHTSGMFTLKGAVAAYQPQLHHNMLVTGWKKAYLAVILGNEWDYEEVDFNEEYAAALLKAEEDFWECVTLKLPPSEEPPIVEPPLAARVVDMSGSNSFTAAAADWLKHRDASKTFAEAAKTLKELVPADARLVTGGGVEIGRNKARSLTIKPLGGDE